MLKEDCGQVGPLKTLEVRQNGIVDIERRSRHDA
jgi:hypothetical protein